MEGVHVGLNRPKRVAVPGELTGRGRPRTKVKRVDEGNVPLAYFSRFPYGVREFFGTADGHYRAGVLPCEIQVDDGSPASSTPNGGEHRNT
jgi:hypothetical protein